MRSPRGSARAVPTPRRWTPKAESALILDLAPHLERFLSQLFGIADEVLALAGRHDELAPLYTVKRQFVQRRAGTRIKPAEAEALDGGALERELTALFGGSFDELTFATHVDRWLAQEAGHARELDLALKYAGWALHTAAGRERHHHGVLFKQPAKVDPHHLLVHAHKQERDGVTSYRIQPDHLRRRNGFELTDPGTDLVGALDQANYCIWCHAQGKDSCSKGLREKPPSRRNKRRRTRSSSRRARSASRSPAARSTRRSPSSTSRRRRASRSPRLRSSWSTTRWPPRPATASATTA